MLLQKILFAAPLFLVACAAAPPPGSHTPATVVTASPNTAGEKPATPVSLTCEGALNRLFSSPAPQQGWFAPTFLAAVPWAQIEAIFSQVRNASGAFQGARVKGVQYLAKFEKAAWEGTAQVDDQGRFTTLLIRPAADESASLDDALSAFRALPGKVSLLVLSDGAEVASIEPTLPLGAGSSFKLAILAALRSEVDRKKRAWKDVVELRDADKSMPSGMLHEWPDSAPITVHTLAGLMISISDNTATDSLLRLVGRAPVEALAPRNKPFLSTREMFLLKAAGGDEALAKFRQGSEPERRKLLQELETRAVPSIESFPREPTALDVEWFFSARELCDLMGKVHDLPLMRINPGLAKKSDWDAVAYKGGEEPGVLSMTTWLQKGAHRHCVSATWNDSSKLDALAFVSAYTNAMSALAK